MGAITELVLTFSENLSDNALCADRKPKLLMLVLLHCTSGKWQEVDYNCKNWEMTGTNKGAVKPTSYATNGEAVHQKSHAVHHISS